MSILNKLLFQQKEEKDHMFSPLSVAIIAPITPNTGTKMAEIPRTIANNIIRIEGLLDFFNLLDKAISPIIVPKTAHVANQKA